MTIAAIPTVYKGIQFRSRLEARWAAFFDFIGGLTWTYEPVDMAAYVPDFHVQNPHSGYQALLVEVKGCSTVEELLEHVAKLNAAGVRGPALLVGEQPLVVLGRDVHPETGAVSWAPVDPIWTDATYRVGESADRLDSDTKRAWAKACNATQWRGRS